MEVKEHISNEEIIKLNNLQVKKSELESKQQHYYNLKQQGQYVRARIKWIKEGDIPSKYFLTLEKRRQGANVLTKLTDNNNVIEDDRQILNETLSFYENLYKAKHIPIQHIEEYFANIKKLKSLTSDERSLCDDPITVDEVTQVVLTLKKNKSPGNDGLTSEFYQAFWQELKPIFMKMLCEAFQKGILPDRTKKSIITLIFKKGDRTLLKNYRPISLTNCDYKILTFALANAFRKLSQI